MAKSQDRGTPAGIEKKGGYPAGPKTTDQLKQPPKTPGIGSKPASDQPKK